MNLLDDLLARIPLTEVTIRTTLSAHSALERVDLGLMPAFQHWGRSEYFTFDGTSEGNYFKMQGHLTNPDGTDAFPPGGYVSIAFIGIPLGIETSPTFYARVFDEGEGAVIRGHFAVPFPILALLIVILLLVAALGYPGYRELLAMPVVFLVIWSMMAMVEYIAERKGILDFLAGLFHDAIKQQTPR